MRRRKKRTRTDRVELLLLGSDRQAATWTPLQTFLLRSTVAGGSATSHCGRTKERSWWCS